MRTPLAVLAILALGAGCARDQPEVFQGYLEGEFVYVASPLGGRLDRLEVARGGQVAVGDPLFTLEDASEAAALRMAEGELRAAEARLEDLRKGSRPSELAALEARLAQARAATELSRLEFDRQRVLHESRVITDRVFDEARTNHERNLRLVDEIDAQLATARLGARSDAINAAEAAVSAAAAARERAAWQVDQKRARAPVGGLVHDTLYRVGEYVAATRPIVVLLPPQAIKVRFFAPEPEAATLAIGAEVRVLLSGRSGPLTARISYVSPRPEFTPPVLYNRDNRSKLVTMIEATLDPADAAGLHPGQPVEVAR